MYRTNKPHLARCPFYPSPVHSIVVVVVVASAPMTFSLFVSVCVYVCMVSYLVARQQPETCRPIERGKSGCRLGGPSSVVAYGSPMDSHIGARDIAPARPVYNSSLCCLFGICCLIPADCELADFTIAR